MTLKADIYKFIDENGPVDIEAIQQEFGCSFTEAQQLVTELRKTGRVTMTSSLQYETT